MIIKKTYIGKSSIQGLGLIAGEKILKGEIMWENNSVSEKIYSQQEWDSLPELFKISIKKYIYRQKGMYHLNLDDSRHCNHSDTPNVIEDEFGNYLAIKDIKKGEEITCDYGVFNDEEWENEILSKK